MTKTIDDNGFWEIRDNPISKAGVFPYLGARLPGAPDPAKVYMVLRPPEELGSEETIESFKLQPWVIRHKMVGSSNKGLTPAEDKGVHGVIGEQVWFDGKTGRLRGNIRGFSETLDEEIKNGVKELSLGYFHDLEWTPGIWNGEAYDAIQRNIRGNHMALVEAGRMGSDVAVGEDGKDKAFDENFITLKEEEMEGKDEWTPEKIGEALKAISERLDKLEKLEKEEMGEGIGTSDTEGVEAGENEEAGSNDEEGVESDDSKGETKSQDNEPPEEEEKKEEKAGASMDAMEKRILKSLAHRDQLAARLQKHVGTFDHSEMTTAELAIYGCKKLGIQCQKGHERTALDVYLGAVNKAHKPTFSMDTAPTGSESGMSKTMEQYLKGGAA